MSTEEYLGIMQRLQVIMVDGDEAHLPQPLTLHAIVHDIAQTVERLACCQFLFCFLDGCRHAEAEAAAVVDFYLEQRVKCFLQ